MHTQRTECYTGIIHRIQKWRQWLFADYGATACMTNYPFTKPARIFWFAVFNSFPRRKLPHYKKTFHSCPVGTAVPGLMWLRAGPGWEEHHEFRPAPQKRVPCPGKLPMWQLLLHHQMSLSSERRVSKAFTISCFSYGCNFIYSTNHK